MRRRFPKARFSIPARSSRACVDRFARVTRGAVAVLIVFVAVAVLGCLLGARKANGAEIERQVSYSGLSASDFDRSYDLYRSGTRTGSLVIFIHSRFWNERQPDRLIGDSFVPGLLEAGHSVAILRHRLVPDGRFPVTVKDAARGVAALLDRVEAGEFDSERIFLAGHSSGAQLALLLALDPSWLRAEGKRPEALAGVVSISGILETQPGAAGSDEEEALYAAAFREVDDRMAASPSSHANPSVASILFLVAARDVPGYRRAATRNAERLRGAGHHAVEVFIANGRDHFSILALDDPRNDARRHLYSYLDSRPRSGHLPEAWRVVSTWRDPPLTTVDFHTRFPELVEEHRADKQFNHILNRPFRTRPGALNRLSVRSYQSIDLIRLLGASDPAEIGHGSWLEIRNARGEWATFNLARLRELSPRLVIGLDGERNLFRVTDLYHTLRRYTWVDPSPERIDMARPLGGFLYFPNEQPEADESNDLVGRYALTSGSFRLLRDDPLAPLEGLPKPLRRTLSVSPGCMGCHQFRGVGGRAFHIRADDGSGIGGHALPLERYPAIVWKRFVFDQAAVAKEVGASAIEFEPTLAKALFDLLVDEKRRRGIEAWTHPDRDRTPN